MIALMFCISWSSSTAVTKPFSDCVVSGPREAAPEWPSAPAPASPFALASARPFAPAPGGLFAAALEGPSAAALLSLLGLRPVMVMLVLAPGSERPLLKVVSALEDEPGLFSGVTLPGPAGVCCCVHLQNHMST